MVVFRSGFSCLLPVVAFLLTFIVPVHAQFYGANIISTSAGGQISSTNISTTLAQFAAVTVGTVTGAISGTSSSGFTTGDLKITWKTTADSGWIMLNDGTIGSASSGATTRADADTSDLYTLIWTNFANAQAAVTGGRGASAAADFAANKAIALPKALSRAIGVAGAGSGLTSRALGITVGEETHTLTASEQANMAFSGTGALSIPLGLSGGGQCSGSYMPDQPADSDGRGTCNASFTFSGGSTSVSGNTTGGGGGAHNVMQPTAFWNVMVKL